MKKDDYGYKEGFDLLLCKLREETDGEYKLRLDKLKDEGLKREREREKIKRKKQYELLKKEFENE